MFTVIILPLAKQDIKEAAYWYNVKQNGLGKRFTAHITEKITLLKIDPYIFSIRYDDSRTAVLDVFPFMIHYTIDETKQIIIITAILHTSRNPAIWQNDRDADDKE